MVYADYIKDHFIYCPNQYFVYKLANFMRERQMEDSFISVGEVINYLREQGMSDILTDEPDALDWGLGWDIGYNPIKSSRPHEGSDVISVLLDPHFSFIGGRT